MNLPISISPSEQLPTEPFNFHFLLEEDPSGQIKGTIAELPDCQVMATTQDEAIAELQQITRDRMDKMTVVSFHLPIKQKSLPKRNPWEKFIGMYEGDPIFAEIAAEQRAERGLEHLGWIE